ncbi:MAG: hypothetical protein DI598_08910, partial [Pseudopedobacter saltans]
VFILVFSYKSSAQPFIKVSHPILVTSLNDGFSPAIKQLNDFGKNPAILNDVNFRLWDLCMRTLILTNDNKFDLPRKFADTTIFLARKANNKLMLSYALYTRAYLDRFSNNVLVNVLEDGQEALSLIEGTDNIELQSLISNLLFNVYLSWGDKDNIIHYIHLSDSLLKKEGSLRSLYMARLNKCYETIIKPTDSSTNQRLIKEYSDLQQLYLNNPKELYRFNYIVCLFNEIDLRMANLRNHLQQEELILVKNKLSTIKQEIKSVVLFKSLFEGNLYLCYSNMNEIEHGKQIISIGYLLHAYKIFETNPSNPSYQKLAHISGILTRYYEATDNPQKAFFYLKSEELYKEKTLNQEKYNAIKKIELESNETKNQLEKQAILLKAKNTRHIYAFSLIGSLILITALFFVLRSYSFKFRYAKEKAAKLHLEKEEFSLKARLADEENARLAMEKELMELRQDRLQRELLTNQLQIVHKNQILNDINEKIKDGQSININKLLKEEKRIDEDFESTKKQIQETHPDFFPKLDNMAQQRLTQLDLKLSAYLHINMDTKQIAHALNIESKSVRMAKYRLKQKLGLPKDVDMDTFIRQMS